MIVFKNWKRAVKPLNAKPPKPKLKIKQKREIPQEPQPLPSLDATVITDASWCPHTQAGGYGAWVSMKGGPICKAGGLRGLMQTSSHAELLAAMNGIWFAYKAGARNILLQTDNLEVVSIINGTSGIGSRRLCGIYLEALKQHFEGARVIARHVRGHTHSQNSRSFVQRWCDAQASIHMRRRRGEINPAVAVRDANRAAAKARREEKLRKEFTPCQQ
jgi:ribonuclease HI